MQLDALHVAVQCISESILNSVTRQQIGHIVVDRCDPLVCLMNFLLQQKLQAATVELIEHRRARVPTTNLSYLEIARTACEHPWSATHEMLDVTVRIGLT